MATARESKGGRRAKPAAKAPGTRRQGRRDDAPADPWWKTDVPEPELIRRIHELAHHLLKHPVEWLDHPNPQFDGKTPNQVIAEGRAQVVLNILECAMLGLR